jgi:hypothetical protein
MIRPRRQAVLFSVAAKRDRDNVIISAIIPDKSSFGSTILMSILGEQIAKTLLPGMVIPDELEALFTWIESKDLFN